MVGIIDFDQAGFVEMVSVHNAAIVFMVFFVQQCIDFADKSRDMLSVGRR
jgi:hypothetical protein